MKERLEEREASLKYLIEMERTTGLIPKIVPNTDMDPEKGLFPRDPYIEGAANDVARKYVRFTPPTKVLEGGLGVQESDASYKGPSDEEAVVRLPEHVRGARQHRAAIDKRNATKKGMLESKYQAKR
ncbi:hypothetical protein CDV36_008958 [Fusarium kuroshium]|uniref:Uncharacterized protein n=1 Tax=Fusarium kuroshium TaxID=2010991 RepID=A0A3M2S2F4_9HYPO|nr:hypothetical protein CDV36_008958 [Fusarium kuroshium]